MFFKVFEVVFSDYLDFEGLKKVIFLTCFWEGKGRLDEFFMFFQR
jgi:hypothetical protein